MEAINIYNARKKDSSTIWLTFLFLGWSYGSMDKIGKQIFFYLTFGGLGFWTLYLLFTLNGKIKAYNKVIAAESGLTTEEMVQLGLI